MSPNLREALAGIKEAQTRTPEAPVPIPPGDYQPARNDLVPTLTRAAADVEAVERRPRISAQAKKARKAKAAKSSSSEYERLTVYVRKTTKKKAVRKWEDTTGNDMSDLVETLLAKYLST